MLGMVKAVEGTLRCQQLLLGEWAWAWAWAMRLIEFLDCLSDVSALEHAILNRPR